MDTGLVKGDCIHEEHRQEYVESVHREDRYRCLGCGEIISTFIDCGSGG